MTKNNLTEHLTWLIRSRNFVPPTHIPIPPSTEPDLSFSSGSEDPLHGQPEATNGAPPNNQIAIDDVGHPLSQLARSQNLSTSLSFHSTNLMARLQSGPRSSKMSKLLSQALPGQLQTPKSQSSRVPSTSLRDQYSAPYETGASSAGFLGSSSRKANRSAALSPSKKVGCSKPNLQTPAASVISERATKSEAELIGSACEIDVHTSSSSTIELFGEPRAPWREDSATRKEPLPKKGKKRKSAELDSGATIVIPQPRQSQEGFVAIDLYLDEDVQAPGTSTAIRPSHSQKPYPTGKKRCVVNHVREQSQKAQTPAENKDALEHYVHTDVIQRSVKTAVADSEEELEDEVDALGSNVTMDSDSVIATTDSKGHQDRYLQPNLDSKYLGDIKCPMVKLQSSPESSTIAALDAKPEMHSSQQQVIGASPFQEDSPTTLCPGQQQPQVRQIQYSAASLQTPLVNHNKVCALSFLELPPYRIREHKDRLEQDRNALAMSLYEQLTGDSNAPAETRQQATLINREIALINSKIGAVKDLLLHRERYARLSRQNDEIKGRLLEVLRTGQTLADYASDIEEQKKSVQELSGLETEITNLLAVSGMPLDEGRPPLRRETAVNDIERVFTNERPTTLVPSTQINQQTKIAPGSRTRVPASSYSTNTQYIQQTQVTNPAPQASARRLDRHPISVERSPIRTYTSSPGPKDVKAYFSPPKRNAHMVESGTERVAPGAIHERVRKPALGNPARKELLADGHCNEAVAFTTFMGSPSQPISDEDDYGEDDDDEEMLEFADELEHRDPGTERGPRNVFAETSGNVIKPDLRKSRPPSALSPPKPIQLQYQWSKELKWALRAKFHLTGFRPNQLEAINATLSGKDTFVLMPTGGGKSLCYQLPSVISSGRTRGVTVVISPLLSLMQDQVEHLKQLDIQALLVNGEVTGEHRRLVMEGLNDPKVENLIQVLYITPEMISKNVRMVEAFRDLHRRQKLARIVIDEAHCVSQWGHDFRPDYKSLGEVRLQFPGVPVMALTATATENVKVDVIHNLKIQGCEVLTQSFNRPNLRYEVRPKGKSKDVLEDIVKLVKKSYRNQSGIIYCLSRKNCEKIAGQLRETHKIKAHHYHAGMDPQNKSEVQRQWQAGEWHVIVATIAFGMGIDKADVRFVIHHTIPKSLEGYYQETGRAGRDGVRSGCYLYYGYQDTSALKRMIDEGDGSYEQKNRQREMLRNVVQFCENKSDCRRVQVLEYFSEHFRPEDCNATCDNCKSGNVFKNEDFTNYAKYAIQLVQQIQEQKVTLLHCVDVLRGGKTKKITDLRHNELEQFGVGSALERGDVERLFYRLLGEDALEEHHEMNKAGFAIQYVHLGRQYSSFLGGHRKVNIQVRISPNGKHMNQGSKPKPRANKNANSRQDFPQSTNVSSPVQAAAKRRNTQRAKASKHFDLSHIHSIGKDHVMRDDGESFYESQDDSDDAFQTVDEQSRRPLGPRITTDEKFASLNSTHQLVVEDFMVHAASESKKVGPRLFMPVSFDRPTDERQLLLEKGLRAQPFTETILREMAITFPRNRDELLKIPGIDSNKVELYGNRFLRLIRQARQGYDAMMQQHEDRPLDPNHQNVIDISSDEEYGGDADLDELANDDSHEEQSAYFHVSPDVEAFNAKFSQIQSLPMAPPTRAQNQSRSNCGGGGRARYARGYRKASSNFGKNKGPSKSAQKPGGSRSGSTSFRKGAPKACRGGIAAMPT